MIASIRVPGLLALLCSGLPASARADDVTVRGSSTGVVIGLSALSFQGTAFAAPRPRTFNLHLQLAGMAGTESVTRTLRAIVTPTAQGGVSIHFTTPEAKVRFDNGTVTGSFAIRAAHLSLEAGQSTPLIAVLSGSQQTDTACRLAFTAARQSRNSAPGESADDSGGDQT